MDPWVLPSLVVGAKSPVRLLLVDAGARGLLGIDSQLCIQGRASIRVHESIALAHVQTRLYSAIVDSPWQPEYDGRLVRGMASTIQPSKLTHLQRLTTNRVCNTADVRVPTWIDATKCVLTACTANTRSPTPCPFSLCLHARPPAAYYSVLVLLRRTYTSNARARNATSPTAQGPYPPGVIRTGTLVYFR